MAYSKSHVLLVLGLIVSGVPLFQSAYAQELQDTSFLIPSIIVTVISAVLAYWFQRKQSRLQHQLDQQKTQFDKLADYKLEAKKRIYQECAPLLFQMVSLSENALFKISDIVYHSGKLVPGTNTCSLVAPGKKFGTEEYNFFKSNTFYKLFVPIVCFKLLSEKLSKEDLDLEPKMAIQYEIGKYLFYTFSGDRNIAKILKDDDYEASTEKDDRLRQGIWGAEIEKLCEFFIVRNDMPRLKRYDEFDSEYMKWKNGEEVSELSKTNLKILENLFHGFNIDEQNKILWRILIDQARMYFALVQHGEDHIIKAIKDRLKNDLNNRNENITKIVTSILEDTLKNYDEELRQYLDWRTMNIPKDQERKYDEENYFKKPIEDLNELLRRRFEKFTLRFEAKTILEEQSQK
jgi:hypothetical protein